MKQIAAAIHKIQADIKGAKKNKRNDHFNRSYADLESVWEALRPHLQKHGLAVVQAPKFRDGVLLLNTLVIHVESGEALEGDYLIRPVKDDPQAYASAMTYARRYSMCGMLGLTNEDDDGNKGSNKGDKEKAAPIDKVKGKDFISAVERIALSKAWKANGWDDAKAADFLATNYEITTTAEVKKTDYPAILTAFSNKPATK